MARFGIGDIDRLIERGAGDADALREVRRALARGEAVSASERDYVMGLIAAHMGPGPRMPPPPAPAREPARRVTRRRRDVARMPASALRAAAQRVAQRPSRRTVIIAVIAVALVASAAISMQAMRADVEPTEPPPALLTDRESYVAGDVIVVSGRAEPGTEVSLSIVGPGGTVWEGTATARADGSYSAMEFAGGAGWVGGAEHAVVASGPGVDGRAAFSYAAPP